MASADKEIREAVKPEDLGLTEEQQQNFEDIEHQFAVKAVEQLEAYWGILHKVKGSELRLTKYDDEIYEHFKKSFPEVNVGEPLDEDGMKSKEGKEKWRNWMKEGDYEHKVKDYNFGIILRKSPKTAYTEDGTMFAVQMQFYAIEIARNREGFNDWVYESAQKK